MVQEHEKFPRAHSVHLWQSVGAANFDLYVIRKSKLKYLLLIRVAKPEGNHNEPTFAKHNNITKKFKHALDSETASLFVGLS